MSNSTQVFNGNKVFLAFRTDLFNSGPDEHMTLKFFGDLPLWGEVIREASAWQSMLPAVIRQNGIGVWKSRDLYHEVAHMSFDGHPSLWGRSWHITLDSSAEPIMPRHYVEDPTAVDIMHELWVGYKDTCTKEKKWITYRNAKHLVRSNK